MKIPKTEALKKTMLILQATITDCKDIHNQALNSQHEPYAEHFYRGKQEGLQSALSLLETLGSQIEEEAHELGYQEGQELARTMGAQGR